MLLEPILFGVLGASAFGLALMLTLFIGER